MIEAAHSYLQAGLCVLPARLAEKRPSVGSWKRYQQRRPTEAELSAWLANNPDAICVLCGAVSGNNEIIDFDGGGELFDAWWQRVPAELRDRLVIECTPSGGYHVNYRCEVAVSGNLKLAQRKDGDRVTTLIETRGEGGLFLCAPTPGYELIQGDLSDPPVLTAEQRDALLQAAWDLNEYTPPIIDGSTTNAAPRSGGDRPGDDFNARGDVREVLERHGWVMAFGGDSGGNERWRRPGKASGWSATLKDRVFYVFSSNASPFEPNQPYSPFAVYATLEHGGDFEQAARALRGEGYGSDGPQQEHPGVDISGIVGQAEQLSANAQVAPADDEPVIRSLSSLIEQYTGLNPPIVHGLLREGETMNVIASPKVGKSWLVSSLAIAIASGMDWLGMTVEPGRVLHIDNELHVPTSVHRYKVLSEAIGVPHRFYGHNIDNIYLRGCPPSS